MVFPQVMIVWTERFNCHVANIGRFRARADWDKGGYRISFEGVELKQREPDLKKAKTLALSLARKKLTEALDALGDV